MQKRTYLPLPGKGELKEIIALTESHHSSTTA